MQKNVPRNKIRNKQLSSIQKSSDHLLEWMRTIMTSTVSAAVFSVLRVILNLQ